MFEISKNFYERISFDGKLEDIAEEVCAAFSFGELEACNLVEIGYEDFNFSLTSSGGKYFVKVYADFRSLTDCRRYVEIMEKAAAAGVAIPRLVSLDGEGLCQLDLSGSSLRLSVMEHIEGDNLMNLAHLPDTEEIRFLVRQAALIASLDLNPEPAYDCWAITNFKKEFLKKKETLSGKDLEVLQALVARYSELQIEKLPHCFVHGDIITSNVIRGINGGLWIIDFSVSNYYPRIQELAVLGCNLLFDEHDSERSHQNIEIALEEYQKHLPLTEIELSVFPDYLSLAHAMHLLSANYEKVAEGNKSEENEYWLSQGRAGLLQLGWYRKVNLGQDV